MAVMFFVSFVVGGIAVAANNCAVSWVHLGERATIRGAYAGIPATEVCMGCHNQIWGGSPMLEPVRASQLSGAPIPWNRVHWLPGFVYFQHAIHVRRFACERCHDRVSRMAAVYQAQGSTPLAFAYTTDRPNTTLTGLTNPAGYSFQIRARGLSDQELGTSNMVNLPASQ